MSTAGPPFLTTVTTKGQITVPARVCKKLGLKMGAKIDIYPVGQDEFRATVRRRSKILDFAGDPKDFDKKENTG